MALVATFTTVPTIDFVGQSIVYDATGSSSGCTYSWAFGDTFTYSSSAISATHIYHLRGSYKPILFVTSGGVHAIKVYPEFIKINNNPSPTFSGTPIVAGPLTFWDELGAYYYTGTVSALRWDFGDGSAVVTATPTSTISKSYSTVGQYTVSVSALNISGAAGVGTTSVGIFQSDICTTKSDFITLAGLPYTNRYGENKKIDLINFLPQYYKGTDTEQFLQIFQDTLNEMFTGLGGITLSSDDVLVQSKLTSGTSADGIIAYHDDRWYLLSGTSADTDATSVQELKLNWPENSDVCLSGQKISILEKIKRLADLQDPDLIDIEYIQYFAKNLGYNIDINRSDIVGSQLGNLATIEEQATFAVDQQKYLRFVVQNLPNWYKIKSTRNAIKIMLYSFGLIGDLIEYYTNANSTDDYSSTNPAMWKYNFDLSGGSFVFNTLKQIPDGWYPTPHFAIVINIDKSTDISFDISKRQAVIRAIDSIRPINTVFMGLVGYFQRLFTMYVGAKTRFSRYIHIGTSTAWPSDYFFTS